MRNSIKTSKKDFQNKRKAYPSAKYALKEIVTNAYFAPGVKNVSLNFEKEDKQSFWFINDGETMTSEQIISAISEYGCKSANTAGNENGMGLKSSASFFTQYSKNSMLAIASKSDNELLGFGWIDPDGNYCEYEDLSTEQISFAKKVLESFKYGTVTMVYDTEIEATEINEFIDDLRYMFTSGLNKINFKTCINGETFSIYPFDRHYHNLDYVRRNDENVIFEYNKKLYKCTLYSTDTRTIKPEDYDFIDETNGDIISDFGIHMGYDNGYMPIHMPQVEIIGYKSKPQYYYMRGSLIAHPVEGETKYAGIEDWKIFFSKIGNMSQQKVPNLSKEINFFHNNGELKVTLKSFYNAVVMQFKNNIQDWMPSHERNTKGDYSQEKLDFINKCLEKTDMCHCDSVWKFRFGYNVDDDNVIKYDQAKKTVVFKFDEHSPLLKRILVGGRAGRNGKNDIETSIIPTIDVFKMDVEDENTTDRVIMTIKKRVRKFNNYYSKEHVRIKV